MSVELYVEIKGVTQEEAEELVDQAHEVCPYSRAIDGNVKVKKTVKAL
ncbi:MAG: OsmC family protein [Alkalibacterium sp.]|nr:OsmC family protein [Alkalibacterium sp.]